MAGIPVWAPTCEWSVPNASHIPFCDIIKALSCVQAMYDVEMLADGGVREDDFTPEIILPFSLVVVPIRRRHSPRGYGNVTLREVSGDVKVHTLDGSVVNHKIQYQGDAWNIVLHQLPVYTVIVIA